MPVRRRKDRRKSAVPPFDIETDLDIGWLSNRTDDEMREAWERYGDHMVERAREATPGMRPVAWWRFEYDRDPPRSVHDEADSLYEMGELDHAEIAAIRQQWRGRSGGAKFLSADSRRSGVVDQLSP